MEESLPLKQSTTYTFKYNSDNDNIDLNTLLLSQMHFATILNEIKNEVAGGTDLSIKIRPLTKGSVPFDIVLNLSWLQSLFSAENVAYAAAIVSTLTSLFQVRLWLKGKKPTKIEVKGDKVIVTIEDQIIEIDRIVYKIYTENPIVDIAIRKGFEAIDRDEDVTGVEILDGKKDSLISISRSSFDAFTTPNEIYDSLVRKETTSGESLTILKIVFDKGYKWQFYLSGRKISATILDNSFIERVNNGERFAKGDVLVVEMEIEKVYDKSVDTYVEKGFKITRVIQHIPRPNQGTIDGLFDEGA